MFQRKYFLDTKILWNIFYNFFYTYIIIQFWVLHPGGVGAGGWAGAWRGAGGGLHQRGVLRGELRWRQPRPRAARPLLPGPRHVSRLLQRYRGLGTLSKYFLNHEIFSGLWGSYLPGTESTRTNRLCNVMTINLKFTVINVKSVCCKYNLKGLSESFDCEGFPADEYREGSGSWPMH